MTEKNTLGAFANTNVPIEQITKIFDFMMKAPNQAAGDPNEFVREYIIRAGTALVNKKGVQHTEELGQLFGKHSNLPKICSYLTRKLRLFPRDTDTEYTCRTQGQRIGCRFPWYSRWPLA